MRHQGQPSHQWDGALKASLGTPTETSAFPKRLIGPSLSLSPPSPNIIVKITWVSYKPHFGLGLDINNFS